MTHTRAFVRGDTHTLENEHEKHPHETNTGMRCDARRTVAVVGRKLSRCSIIHHTRRQTIAGSLRPSTAESGKAFQRNPTRCSRASFTLARPTAGTQVAMSPWTCCCVAITPSPPRVPRHHRRHNRNRHHRTNRGPPGNRIGETDT